MAETVSPTILPRRRWLQFGLRQMLESMVWIAVAMTVVKLIFLSFEWTGDLGVFAIAFVPGALFGAAIGALINKRPFCMLVGTAAWLGAWYVLAIISAFFLN